MFSFHFKMKIYIMKAITTDINISIIIRPTDKPTNVFLNFVSLLLISEKTKMAAVIPNKIGLITSEEISDPIFVLCKSYLF